MAVLLYLLPHPISPKSFDSKSLARSKRWVLCCSSSRRTAVSSITSLALALTLGSSPLDALPDALPNAPSRKPALPGISNTRSWFQFFGDGFSIRVPPQFEDLMEPEDYNAGLSLYGDKVKPKTFAARFASSDRSEVISVVTRLTNQLKITFLEAKDIADLGSLKKAAKIFVPGGANLYSARTIKIKEDEGLRYHCNLSRRIGYITATLSIDRSYQMVSLPAVLPPLFGEGEGGCRTESGGFVPRSISTLINQLILINAPLSCYVVSVLLVK